MLHELVQGLRAAATTPLGLVAYALLLVAVTYLIVEGRRLSRISRILKYLPAADRAKVLHREYSVLPRAGVTAEQWLRAKRQQLSFLSFLAVIVALTIIVVVRATSRNQERPAPQRTSAEADEALASRSALSLLSAPLYFRADRSDLEGKYSGVLEAKATILRLNPDVHVSLYGHTTVFGTDEYNQAIGDRMARYVRSQLVERGAPAANLETDSKGETEPREDNTQVDTRGFTLNRRVEFRVQSEPREGLETGHPTEVLAVEMAPSRTHLWVGERVQLVAVGRSSAGRVVVSRVPSWFTSDRTIATVDAEGIVEGVSAGRAVVTARIDEVAREGEIRVEEGDVLFTLADDAIVRGRCISRGERPSGGLEIVLQSRDGRGGCQAIFSEGGSLDDNVLITAEMVPPTSGDAGVVLGYDPRAPGSYYYVAIRPDACALLQHQPSGWQVLVPWRGIEWSTYLREGAAFSIDVNEDDLTVYSDNGMLLAYHATLPVRGYCGLVSRSGEAIHVDDLTVASVRRK